VSAEPGGHVARVIAVGRNAAWIAFEDETTVRLAALAKNLERLALVVGDLVVARRLEDERVLVVERLPRDVVLERMTAGGRSKTMAANIDGLAIVAAYDRPALHLAMIDELLAYAELHGLHARLALTKADLDPLGAANPAGPHALYAGLGYPIDVLDPRTGGGMAAFGAALEGERTLLVGQSGVGKSSIFAALGGAGVAGDVSKIGRGRQTTTTGRLYRLATGFLIDSPGVGEFELDGPDAAGVAGGFIEIDARAGTCRFGDCAHRHEPGCAVVAAVGTGEIVASRYASYLAILERALPPVRRML